jgi:hypothetical protein
VASPTQPEFGGFVQLNIDAREVLALFEGKAVEAVQDEIIAAMRHLTGVLEYLVLQNIETMFTEGGVRSLHGRHAQGQSGRGLLQSAVLGEVTWADMLWSVTGTVSIDLETAPFARILEIGGITSPHIIRPVRAAELGLPIETLTESLYETGGSHWSLRSPGRVLPSNVLLVHEVHHPGSRFIGRYYMSGALAELSRMVGDDLVLAVRNAILRFGSLE